MKFEHSHGIVNWIIVPRFDIQPSQRMALTELLLLLFGSIYNGGGHHEALNLHTLCGIPDGRHDRRSPAVGVAVRFVGYRRFVEQCDGGRLDQTWRCSVVGWNFDAWKTRIAILRERFIGRIGLFLTSVDVGVVFVLEDTDEIFQFDVFR